MLHDWGSRGAEFIKLNARARERLVELAGGQGTHVVEGLRALGFETLPPDALQAPIIVTMRMPADAKFSEADGSCRRGQRGHGQLRHPTHA